MHCLQQFTTLYDTHHDEDLGGIQPATLLKFKLGLCHYEPHARALDDDDQLPDAGSSQFFCSCILCTSGSFPVSLRPAHAGVQGGMPRPRYCKPSLVMCQACLARPGDENSWNRWNIVSLTKGGHNQKQTMVSQREASFERVASARKWIH